ncbi:MAG: DNA topoisomerase I [Omnitrophica bacterium RIFCSPHIGHO2_02_FULL_46_20]|nr:MAG: DNA topoisomerase I [Omnitrophica bacterium RIFCSPHIGHO2_02_FULL_46_20]OGW94293.1 MAG: DNA topoisomerase I [Omnitrophica bacterium RIFCSPLOWO2_12_FULL_45_13]
MAKKLVIVESPAKSKTIRKFLGPDYVVEASMGHIIDLPKKTLGIDVENNFEPEYIVIPDRRKNLAALKKEAKTKEAVYLAADPDREGEAISWHLKNALADEKNKFYRVTFDEITKDAVQAAFKHPRDIDMNLVNAQQARRILDRLVGYTLSPLLWKKVSRGLSAGRVQSVAARLIVEREEEIKKFNSEEYWEIEAQLKRKGDAPKEKFKAMLEKYQNKPIDIKKHPESEKVLEILNKENYIVSDIRETKRRKKPYPSFTTSKLQQEAFNKLRFSSVKSMHVAQTLYEGVEIGSEGSIGLITYMRTDSVRISKDAQDEAKKYILEKYGKKYYPEVPNLYKAKKRAQEAHEAIRPTSPLRPPHDVKDYLTPDQMKLYTLIWNRFISSQMTESILAQTTVDIKAGDYLFRTSATKVIFDGYAVFYETETDKEEEKEKEGRIPQLSVDEPLDLLELLPSQHFTKPPPRYSDGSLVKALEELGIGRPSTYAPTISTIVTRDYVRRESGYLKPTELGTIVTKLLMEHFPKVLDVEFTAKMEDELDGIEEGEIDWKILLKSFYSPFMHTVEKAKLDMKDVKKEIVSTNEICELCGKPMVIKWGRRGKFLSCSDYPRCKSAKSITSGVKCPAPGCIGELVERRSKRGMFYGCTKFPACRYTARKLPDDKEEAKEVI